jgi:hypothetical protein
MWCVWLNSTIQMNKTHQMNQINSRPAILLVDQRRDLDRFLNQAITGKGL